MAVCSCSSVSAYWFDQSFDVPLGLAWLGLAWLGLAWLGLAWLGDVAAEDEWNWSNKL
jgi:hypothetical protein